MKKGNLKIFFIDLIYDLIGSFIYAAGINIFTKPNSIAPGGVTGISIIVNHLCNLPVGVVNFIINIPLIVLSYFKLGKSMTLKTLKSVAVLSLMIDLFAYTGYAYTNSPLLSGLFGGLMMGAGLSIVYLRGSTTGGLDIVVRVIQRHFRHFPIGKIMMCTDFVVLVAGAISFKNIDSFMFGLITIFTTSKTIDTIIYGMYKGKVVHIFSEKEEEIADKVIHTLDRGGTFLKAQGAFTHKDTNVLMCAVRNSQFPELKKIVYSIDPKAFIIVSEAAEIVGEGFKDKDNQL